MLGLVKNSTQPTHSLIPARDLGLPRRDPVLDRTDQVVEPDRHHHEDDDRNEHGRGVEIVGGVDDHRAQPGNRGEELGDHHGDHGPTDGEANARHDVGQGRRQDDPPQDDTVGRDEGLAHLDQGFRYRCDAEPGVDADREYGHQEHDRDLDREAEAEPQHEERHQGDQRHRIAGGDVEADRGFHGAEASGHQAQRNAHNDGEPVAEKERLQAVEQRRPQLAGAGELPERLRDRARIRAEHRIDVAPEELPGAEQHAERGERDDPFGHRPAHLLFHLGRLLAGIRDVDHETKSVARMSVAKCGSALMFPDFATLIRATS